MWQYHAELLRFIHSGEYRKMHKGKIDSVLDKYGLPLLSFNAGACCKWRWAFLLGLACDPLMECVSYLSGVVVLFLTGDVPFLHDLFRTSDTFYNFDIYVNLTVMQNLCITVNLAVFFCKLDPLGSNQTVLHKRLIVIFHIFLSRTLVTQQIWACTWLDTCLSSSCSLRSNLTELSLLTTVCT